MKNNRGSVTLEASIIAPITILCVIALIYMAAILYQKACLQKEADLAVERAAAVWSNSKRDINTGALSISGLEGDELYSRLFDQHKHEKLDRLKSSIDLKRSVLKGDEYITAGVVDYVVYKKLIVTVEGEYKIPGGKLLGIFGIGDKFTVEARSEAVINDPAEFIRNTDLVIDTVREIKREFPQLGEAGDKLREIMNSINGRISDFFNDG